MSHDFEVRPPTFFRSSFLLVSDKSVLDVILEESDFWRQFPEVGYHIPYFWFFSVSKFSSCHWKRECTAFGCTLWCQRYWKWSLLGRYVISLVVAVKRSVILENSNWAAPKKFLFPVAKVEEDRVGRSVQSFFFFTFKFRPRLCNYSVPTRRWTSVKIATTGRCWDKLVGPLWRGVVVTMSSVCSCGTLLNPPDLASDLPKLASERADCSLGGPSLAFPRCLTSQCLKSFLPASIELFNSLPASVSSCSSRSFFSPSIGTSQKTSFPLV